MASLKEVKGRIASVNNTRKITSAMKMVASAKLQRKLTEKQLDFLFSNQRPVYITEQNGQKISPIHCCPGKAVRSTE